MSTLPIGLSALSIVVLSTLVAAQTRSWDAAGDFTRVSNPTGAWHYGWSGSTTGPIIPFTLNGIRDGGIEWWFRGAPGLATFPAILYNPTTLPLNIGGAPGSAVAAKDLIMHPGPGETFAVLRWLCPCPGWYQVTSRFRGNSSACGALSSTADVHILKNATERFAAQITGFGSTASSQLTLFLMAGDSISIVVGNGPGDDIGCDHIETDVTISELGPAASPWPMHQHDARHTGRSPYFGPTTATLAWSFPLPEEPGGLAIGPDGTIYVATGSSFHDNSGHLFALNPGGTLKWSFALPTAPAMVPNHTTPAIAADGTIYLHVVPDSVAAPQQLYAILPDGTEKWHYDLDGGLQTFGTPRVSSPTIGSDGTIYVASRYLTALNPDGTLKWSQSYLVNSRTASPAIAADGSILCSDLFSLDKFSASGSLIWHSTYTNGSSDGSLSISDGGLIHLIAYSSSHNLAAISSNGTNLWSAPVNGGSVFGGTPATAASGNIYITDGVLKSFTSNGTPRWSGGTFSGTYCELLIDAAENIYTRSAWGLSATTSTGAPLFSVSYTTATGSNPASNMAIGADGTLYVPVGDTFGNNQVLRAYAGPSQPPLYQINTPAATITLDGVTARPREAAILNACAGSTVTLNVSSTVMTAAGTWDLAVVAAPSVPLGAGGVTAPYGIVNLNLLAPGSFWLFGGSGPSPLPWIGDRALSFNLPQFPLTVSVQAVFLPPTGNPALMLTQACQLNIQ